jgi:Fe-S cluster assembly protein SufD
MKTSFQSNNQVLSTAQMLSSALQKQIATETKLQIPENDWLKTIRLNAYSEFLKQNLPTRKVEHWKYNDMFFLTQAEFHSTPLASKSNSEISDLTLELPNAFIFIFINGQYSPEHSSDLIDSNVSATPFSQANEQQIELVSSCLSSAQQNTNLLIQLNAGLSQDGLLIEVESNKKIDKPIYLFHLNTCGDENQIFANQILISCGTGSECQLIEHFVSEKCETTQLALQQSVIHLQPNSQCDHYRLNLETTTSMQVSRALFLLDKDSSLNSFYYSEGSQLNKTDIDIRHQGKNSESNLTGIYLPSKTQCIDYHTNIEHRVANCTSREVFRGIIADSAKATFNGKIHIFKDAQKSDAQLSNKNLLLTNQAEINTKPELEIYADDVVCAHGATVAKIDNKAVYYMQTRGINETRAKKMLSIGFINELLERVENEPLSHYLIDQIQSCLSDIK